MKVAHRDIKPENILISSLDPMNIKLGDFGVSANIDELKTECGTHRYAAPEVFTGSSKQSYDAAVDIWSAAILVFERVSPKMPPMGHLKFFNPQLWAKLIRNAVDLLDHTIDLNQLLERMLQMTPNQRPSAEECLNDPLFLPFMTQYPNEEIPDANTPYFEQEIPPENVHALPKKAAELQRLERNSAGQLVLVAGENIPNNHGHGGRLDKQDKYVRLDAAGEMKTFKMDTNRGIDEQSRTSAMERRRQSSEDDLLHEVSLSTPANSDLLKLNFFLHAGGTYIALHCDNQVVLMDKETGQINGEQIVRLAKHDQRTHEMAIEEIKKKYKSATIYNAQPGIWLAFAEAYDLTARYGLEEQMSPLFDWHRRLPIESLSSGPTNANQSSHQVHDGVDSNNYGALGEVSDDQDAGESENVDEEAPTIIRDPRTAAISTNTRYTAPSRDREHQTVHAAASRRSNRLASRDRGDKY